MQTIHREYLYSLWQTGEVSLLMTTSPDHYKCGHIPGSRYFSSSITKTLPALSSADAAITPNPVDSRRDQPLPEQVRYVTTSALDEMLDEMMPLGIIRDISGFRITGKTPVAIVLYSRARSSLVTHWAYQLLREQYRHVFVYEGGLQDWLEAGYPISFADAITEAAATLTAQQTDDNQHALSRQQRQIEEAVSNTSTAASPPQPTPSMGSVLIPKGEQP